MTIGRRNINHVVQDRLCTGCGVCENACPRSAIALELTRGLIAPRVDEDRCTTCGICDQVCPGHSVNTVALGQHLFPEAVASTDIGRYVAAFSGHCNDGEDRLRSASGGLVTALLRWLLRTGKIDGAIVIRFNAERHLEPEAFIARSEEQLATSRSSKYCPVALGGVLREVMRTPGRYAVVGLPCHLHGIRKMEQRFPALARRIAWRFGIFCSGTRSFGATEFYLSQIGVRPEEVREFAYRDEGCLGNMKLTLQDGQQLRWPYKDYYPSIRSFFLPERCTLCHDQCAELADLSFGDLHIPEFWDDKVGTGSVIARSRAARELLLRAVAEDVVSLTDLDPSLVIKSQRHMLRRKKHDVPVRLGLWRALGRNVPAYDADFSTPTTRDIVRTVYATTVLEVERFVGQHRSLWWIIRRLSRATPPTRYAAPTPGIPEEAHVIQ